MANNTLFWNQMLMRSDSIVDIDSNATDAVEQVRAQLTTITEQFDRVFDPADQFEEYVAVALCQALQRALTPKIVAPVCKVAVQKKPSVTTDKSAMHIAKPAPQMAAKARNSKAAKKSVAKKPSAQKNNAKPHK